MGFAPILVDIKALLDYDKLMGKLIEDVPLTPKAVERRFFREFFERMPPYLHWTKRHNKTFTDIDVIRIWMRWLDVQEQENVANFFTYGRIDKYESLMMETFQFFVEMTFLIHDLFQLQLVQVYLRYKELLVWRQKLLKQWLDMIEKKWKGG